MKKQKKGKNEIVTLTLEHKCSAHNFKGAHPLTQIASFSLSYHLSDYTTTLYTILYIPSTVPCFFLNLCAKFGFYLMPSAALALLPLNHKFLFITHKSFLIFCFFFLRGAHVISANRFPRMRQGQRQIERERERVAEQMSERGSGTGELHYDYVYWVKLQSATSFYRPTMLCECVL